LIKELLVDTFDINPKYALDLFEWEASEVPAQDLTQWTSQLKIDHVEVLYVFGLGDGGLYSELSSWLHGNLERRLVILESNTGHIASAIKNSLPLLSDSQVSLEWLNQETLLLQELAEKFPTDAIEVICLPGKDTSVFRKIRLSILRKTSLTHSLFIDRRYGDHLFRNFVKNVPQLEGGFYANGLQNAFSEMPAIICGAGPSLQSVIETLKTLKGRAIIIAGGSAIAALSSVGIEPHFAMAIDPNEEEFKRMQNSFAFECPFLFSTRVHPSVFQTCNGPFGYLRSGVGGMPELWLEEELGLTGPLLGENLSDESISVTSIALAFAQHIGCKTILLSGMDLAYTGGRRYAPGIGTPSTEKTSVSDRLLRRKDKNGQFVKTAVRWVMEAASLSHYAKKHPEIRWINTTGGGLPIPSFEQMDLDVATSTLLTQKWDIAAKVVEQINLNPIPKSLSLNPLFESLRRVIAHLEVLAGERPGPKSLAEMDMREEVAFSILLYDAEKVASQALSRKSIKNNWSLVLELARNHVN
jgi:hypothetical protein